MHRQSPETETETGRSGLLETISARFAAEDAARSAWLDARAGSGRRQARTWPARRIRSACVECGLRSGHHPGCTRLRGRARLDRREP
jgi:hypothetical protein